MKYKKIHLLSLLFMLSLVFLVSPLCTAKSSPIFRLVYVVQAGDNLTTIAKKFDTKISLLKNINNLSDSSILIPGDEVYIPFDDEDLEEKFEFPSTVLFTDQEEEFQIIEWDEYIVKVAEEPQKVKIPKGDRIVYHIKRGDNLYNLAREFNTSVAVLKALNNLDTSIIRVGQKILLPTAGLTPKQVIAKTISSAELNLLARVVHGEARGEPYIGQVAVAAVILNRVLSKRFPNTIDGVIYQNMQFESVTNGQFNLRPSSSAYRAANEALKGFDPTLGAIYFLNPKVASNTNWFDKRQKTVTIGDHVFAR